MSQQQHNEEPACLKGLLMELQSLVDSERNAKIGLDWFVDYLGRAIEASGGTLKLSDGPRSYAQDYRNGRFSFSHGKDGLSMNHRGIG